MRLAALGLGCSLAVAACTAAPHLGGSANIKIAQGAALPPPNRHDLVAADPPYLIGPFDKLTISVFGVEELKQEEVQTDASGRITLPLAGVILAGGKTSEEVAAAIATRLSRYIRDPQVAVNLKDTVSQVVTVDGQVTKPGLYPVVGRMTLMRAVASASGTTDVARLSDVVIFRTVDSQQMAALFNLKDIRRGKYDDPEVYANDVVVVGDSPTQHILKDVLQIAPSIFTTTAVLIRR